MSEFNKEAQISARIHVSEKEKLKKSGYNARQAIEYFNSVASNKLDALKIEEYFLNKEIEDLKMDLIAKEMRLEEVHKIIDEYHIDKLSTLRVDSYKKIIGIYTRDRSNQTFEQFISGNYIQSKFISLEVDKFPECDMDEFCSDLLEYYENVILLSNTN